MKTPPSWMLKALRDPNLSDREWTLLKLGPQSLAEAFHMQALKLRYSLKEY
tara:strand:- start:38 stop:190 length:153 start_codon:yes stop_codon:yes gene_type:complete